MKLLAVGDMHLGRRPSRLPPDLSHPAAALGPAAAWRRTVEFALDRKVRAVLLAGDVVESDRDFYEGFGELKRGVDRLAAGGIQVIAVAGNHDVLVLPRLAELLEGSHHFKLLGKHGVWESMQIDANTNRDPDDTGEHLTLWGWSFPARQVTHSPLAGARFSHERGFSLGLLHCDLGQAESVYAPVSRSELAASGHDAWLLGHIHQPDALTTDSPVGYLGSLSGLNPKESGPRGPWLLEIEGGRLQRISHIPLAPIRWLKCDLAVSDLANIEELDQRLVTRIANLEREIQVEALAPRAVGLRLTLTGRSELAGRMHRWAQDKTESPPTLIQGERDYFIESCVSKALPELRLEALAEQQNPMGLLARKILLLDEPREHPERAALIREARGAFANALETHGLHTLESSEALLHEHEIAERLRQAATHSINLLYAEQQGDTE